MTTLVTVDLAQLLIQKGYDLHPDFKDSYPTIAKVCMWLYEKHGIWISVFSTDDVTMFSYKLSYKFGHYYSQNFNSPKEAYKAAIEYTLKNLL